MDDTDIFKNKHLYEDEETIVKTINYLKLNDPKNANREYAIGFLKFMQRFAFHAEKVGELNYDDFFEKYKQSRNDA